MTVVLFCLFGLNGIQTALASSSNPQCFALFESGAILRLQMNPQYVGENKGLYIDPMTGSRWKVKYFNQQEKAKHNLFLKNGRFVSFKGKFFSSPFDHESSEYESILFVIDRNYNFLFLPKEQRGKFHHSTLTSGEDVLFAGTAIIINGRLVEISNNSGHYKPSTRQTLEILKFLKNAGVDLSHLKLTGPAAKELSGTFSVPVRQIVELEEHK